MPVTTGFGKRGQIYGAIINDSRSFAYSVRDTLGGKESSVVKRIFYRHFAAYSLKISVKGTALTGKYEPKK